MVINCNFRIDFLLPSCYNNNVIWDVLKRMRYCNVQRLTNA